MTALDAAREIGVRLSYVYTLLHEGRLKAQRVDGEWAISAESVRDYALNRSRKARAEARLTPVTAVDFA